MKKILILGGGFSAISVAQYLGKIAKRKKYIEVAIVCENNYFVFQPMLPEVASGGLEASHIINPIRRLCKNVTFHRAKVDNIDMVQKKVRIIGADFTRQQELEFDELVIGLGLSTDFSRVPGMAEHALPMKTLGDAFFLRNEMINKLEEASIEKDAEIKQKLLTFTVIGGGFSGVETIGEIADMVKSALTHYPQINKKDLRFILVHSGKRILMELSEKLGTFAAEKCRYRGIEVMLETRVKEVSPECIILSDDTEIPCRTVIATTGNAPHEVITELPFINDRGRLDTNASFQVVQKDQYGEVEKIVPNVWALGDCAFIPNLKEKPKDGSHPPCPPTAQFAIRQGPVCAKNIIANLNQKKLKQFKFKELGQMAIIGHLTGVAEVMGICFSGILAFALWRFVYWSKIPGLYCKFRVLIDWSIHFLFPVDITQLSVFRTEKVDKSHYQADSYIFHEGDIADYFYVIEKGEVEILKEEEDGTETLLATLKEGDSFGEMGLMQQAPRNASVKCKTPVGVLKINRHDFKALTGSYSNLRTQLEEKIAHITKVNENKLSTLNDEIIPGDTETLSGNSFENKSLVYQSSVSQAQPSLAYKRQAKENRSTNSENQDIMKGQDEMNEENGDNNDNNNTESMNQDNKQAKQSEDDLMNDMDILPSQESNTEIDENFFFEEESEKKEMDLDHSIDFDETTNTSEKSASEEPSEEGILDTGLDEDIEDLIIDIDGSVDEEEDTLSEPTTEINTPTNSIFSTLKSTFNNWVSVKKPSKTQEKETETTPHLETTDCLILSAEGTPSGEVCAVPNHDLTWKAPETLLPIIDKMGNDRFTDYIAFKNAYPSLIPVIGYQGSVAAFYKQENLSHLPLYLRPIYSEELKLPREAINDNPKGQIIGLYNLFPYEEPDTYLRFNLDEFQQLRPEILDGKLSMDENGNVIWIEVASKRDKEINTLVNQVSELNQDEEIPVVLEEEDTEDGKQDEETIEDMMDTTETVNEEELVQEESRETSEDETPDSQLFDEEQSETDDLIDAPDTLTEETITDSEDETVEDEFESDNNITELTPSLETDEVDAEDEWTDINDIEDIAEEDEWDDIEEETEDKEDETDEIDSVFDEGPEDTPSLELADTSFMDDEQEGNLDPLDDLDLPDSKESENMTEEDSLFDESKEAVTDHLNDTIVPKIELPKEEINDEWLSEDNDTTETPISEDIPEPPISEATMDLEEDTTQPEEDTLLDPQYVLEEAGIIPQQKDPSAKQVENDWDEIPDQPYSVRESLHAEGGTGIIEEPTPNTHSQEWKDSKVLPETPKTANYYFEKGISHRNNGELDEALAAFEKTLSLQSTHTDAKSRLGEIYRKKGDLDQAITLLTTCLQSQEDHLFSLLNLGLCFLTKKEYKKAAKIYQFTLDYHPNDFDVLFGLGESLRLLSHYSLAEKALREAIKLNEQNLRPYLSLGYSLVKQEQVTKAKRLYGFAITKLDSDEDKAIIQGQLERLG